MRIQRRHVLGIVIGCMALPSFAFATQALRDGVFVLRASHTQSRPGTVEISFGRLRGQWAQPGRMLRRDKVLLYARNNANTEYALDVRRNVRSASECGQGLLSLGGRTVASGSYGSGPTECSLFFELDRAFADEAARRWNVRRQDRSPVGERATADFAPSRARYARGEAVEIVVTLRNPADAPAIQWQRGGRQRGPRDNQFSFRIRRDGQPVTPIEAFDFGGLAGFIALPPGGTAEVRTPVAPWGDVSLPGRYEVECTYETVLVPGGVQPWTDDAYGSMWDRTFTGRVTFEVR
ncbi:MAG: hypothetical protein IT379_00795 [Deltaproteobacteria bacterium]|nr:hypothetical protein [Deltaproteobacteria bacterium]